VACGSHDVLFPLPKDSRKMVVYAWRTAGERLKTSRPTKSFNEEWPATLRGKRCYCRDERAWLDRIRTLAYEWLGAVEAADRSWIAQAATRIQRYDDRSDGLIDLVVA